MSFITTFFVLTEPESISASLVSCSPGKMFKNLVTLVTGGSSVLGKATAEYFVGKGGRVILTDLSKSNGAAVAEAIGANALFVPADVSSESDVESLMTTTMEKFGQLNVIVNCHSVPAPFIARVYDTVTKESHKLEDFQKVLTANIIGTFNVVRLGVPLLARNEPDADGERGVIINTVLAPSCQPQLGQIANETASGSIEAMTNVWAAEFASRGLRSIAIAQGHIGDSSASAKSLKGIPQHFAQLVHTIVTTPYINATTITLDGCIKS